jgi:hypothetical protein
MVKPHEGMPDAEHLLSGASAVAAALLVFLLLLLLLLLLRGSLSTVAPKGYSSAQRAEAARGAGGGVWWLLQRCWAVWRGWVEWWAACIACFALPLLLPLLLSYALDHHLLWRVDPRMLGSGARSGGGEVSGRNGTLGRGSGDGRGLGTQVAQLRGKVAVVVGGSQGVGLQVSRALQGLGATVVVSCPDRDACSRTMLSLAKAFTPADGAWAVTPMKLDLCSLRSIRLFVAAIKEKYEVLYSSFSCPSRLGFRV